MKTLVAYDPAVLEHDTGPGHPESIARAESIFSKLQKLGSVEWIEPWEPASLSLLNFVHNSKYTEQLFRLEGRSGYLDGDTPFSAGSIRAAQVTAGSGIALVDQILLGHRSTGFALARPPGHHAEIDFGMGFCLLNNVAIAAEYLKSKGFQRICILDWDVHHGNGTQNIFYEDPQVYFVSFHQYPFYPGSGSSEERGKGAGLGKTLNLPLPRLSDEADYLKAWLLFEREMLAYSPEIYLVSAGFDAHESDPLGEMNLTTRSFGIFTRKLKQLAQKSAQGRILSFLEGGYDLRALADSVALHVGELSA